MVQSIGFKTFDKDWEGPVVLLFDIHDKSHNKVIQYRHQFGKGLKFQFYVPKFLLHNLANNEIPDQLLVAIGKTIISLQTIGFQSFERPPQIIGTICEYDYDKEYVNSHRYSNYIEGQNYCIYIPKFLFNNEPYPKRIYAQIGIPN